MHKKLCINCASNSWHFADIRWLVVWGDGCPMICR
jgi:hypothetical protein